MRSFQIENKFDDDEAQFEYDRFRRKIKHIKYIISMSQDNLKKDTVKGLFWSSIEILCPGSQFCGDACHRQNTESY